MPTCERSKRGSRSRLSRRAEMVRAKRSAERRAVGSAVGSSTVSVTSVSTTVKAADREMGATAENERWAPSVKAAKKYRPKSKNRIMCETKEKRRIVGGKDKRKHLKQVRAKMRLHRFQMLRWKTRYVRVEFYCLMPSFVFTCAVISVESALLMVTPCTIASSMA